MNYFMRLYSLMELRNFENYIVTETHLIITAKINVLLITHELSGVSFVSMHVWSDTSNNVTYSLLELYHVYPQRGSSMYK